MKRPAPGPRPRLAQLAGGDSPARAAIPPASSKFNVGQVVQFVPGLGDTHIPTGNYTVTRVMPRDHEDRTYRVRSLRDGQERVLPEQQLRGEPAGPLG